MKLYEAMIWIKDPTVAGQRVSVTAKSLEDAKSRLEAEYGKGTVFDLHSAEDANRSR